MTMMRSAALIALILALALPFGSAQYIAPGQNNTPVSNGSNYTSWNGTGLPTTPTGTNYSELNVTGQREQEVINNTYQEITGSADETNRSNEGAKAGATGTNATAPSRTPGFETAFALAGLVAAGYFLSYRRD
jgi:hypothetical protein